ncbi:hypothetical protein KAI87_03305, partial [Myxococcota bacterium]|nr:hypothetical protein [Myxococcota bacterium]
DLAEGDADSAKAMVSYEFLNDEQNTVWRMAIGTANRWTIYDSETDSTKCNIDPPDENNILSITLDSHSSPNLWLGSTNRLVRCTPPIESTINCTPSCSAFKAQIDNDDNQDIRVIYFDDAATPTDLSDDMLWLGGVAKGLDRVFIGADTNSDGFVDPEPDGVTAWQDAEIGSPLTKPLYSKQVNAITMYKPSRRLFIATSGGLSVFNVGGFEAAVAAEVAGGGSASDVNQARFWTKYKTNDLPSDTVHSLAIDEVNHRLWVGTEDGLVRVDLSSN